MDGIVVRLTSMAFELPARSPGPSRDDPQGALRRAVVESLRVPHSEYTAAIERHAWLLLFGVLLLLSLLTMPQLALQYWMRGVVLPVHEVVLSGLATWAPFALLAPFVVWMARRNPLEPHTWKRSLVWHVLASLVVCLGYATLRWAVSHVPLVDPEPLPFWWLLVSQFYLAFQSYWVLVAVHQAWHNYKRFRDRALRASQLEARLARAQLEVLKGQLHPHFLFNTLNAISTLVHRDAHAADAMITQLSDLLRMSLDSIGVQEVRLGQEIDFLSRYFDIQRTRFQDRLRISVDVPEDLLGVMVPNQVLQPIAENAIKHGLATRPECGRIDVVARRHGPWLDLTVRDDGPGFRLGPEGLPVNGIGLRNTRERLRELYGPGAVLTLSNHPKGGAEVRLRLPLGADASVPSPQEGVPA
jgi:two-component system, LytTR family, sensor kinase